MAENSVRDEKNEAQLLTGRCELCGVTDNLKVCARCKLVYYCTKTHQQADWSRHKKICKKISNSTNQKLENQSAKSMGLGVVVNDIENLRLGTRMENVTSADEHNNIDHEGRQNLVGRDGRRSGSGTITNSRQTTVNAQQTTTNTNTRRPSSEEEDIAVGSSEKFILESEETTLKQPDYSHIPDLTSPNKKDSQNKMRQPNQTYFSVVEARNKSLGEYVSNCLNSYGVCVIDNFLGDSKAMDIWKEVNMLYGNKSLTSGQLVNMVSPKGTVRGDLITWVDGSEKGCEDVNFLITSIDAIMLHCQKCLDHYTVKGRSKAMVAVYPENSQGFLRHVDNPTGDGRCVTCIYYLNKNWNSKVDGGLLRIFPEGQNKVANVEPKFDRLLFFWSDRRNPHEVLPSYRTRFAVTVWYYDEEERRRAVKKLKHQDTHFT